MSGIHDGVQALVKSEESRALYVHCLAHSLNLCKQDVTRKCSIIRNTLEMMNELVQLIKLSPKRLSLFEALKKDIAMNSGEAPTSNLQTLCPTRWRVRHSAINAVLDNYKILQNVLEKVEGGHDEYAAKAHGLLLKMESFDMYFGLKLAYLIFSAAEQLSINLQAKSTTVQEETRGANLLHAHFKSQRIESKFDFFL